MGGWVTPVAGDFSYDSKDAAAVAGKVKRQKDGINSRLNCRMCVCVCWLGSVRQSIGIVTCDSIFDLGSFPSRQQDQTERDEERPGRNGDWGEDGW